MTKLNYLGGGTKVSFFWDPSQDMSSSSFPTKKTALLIGRLYRSANQRPAFLAGNHLNSCPDSDVRKTDFNTPIPYCTKVLIKKNKMPFWETLLPTV